MQPFRQAEAFTCSWLEERGWKILRRNYRIRRAEVDILAIRDDILAAVEVKLAVDGSATLPLEKIDMEKQARIVMATTAYLASGNYPDEVRFDVAVVRGSPPDLRMDTYLEDAFRPDI